MFRSLFDNPVILLVLIVLIVVLLGWKRLPDMARSLGRSSRILKSEIDEMKTESNRSKASGATVEGETANPVHDANGNPVHSGDPVTRTDAHRNDV